ncbi:unnamed protein product, partial [Chrysoparadoxa australica]
SSLGAPGLGAGAAGAGGLSAPPSLGAPGLGAGAAGAGGLSAPPSLGGAGAGLGLDAAGAAAPAAQVPAVHEEPWRREMLHIAEVNNFCDKAKEGLLKCCAEVEAAAKEAKQVGSNHSAIAAALLDLESGRWFVQGRLGPGVASARAGLSQATQGAHAEARTHSLAVAEGGWARRPCAQVVSCCPCGTCAQAILDLRSMPNGPAINLVIYGHSAAVNCDGAKTLRDGIKKALAEEADAAAAEAGAAAPQADPTAVPECVFNVNTFGSGLLKRRKSTRAGPAGSLKCVGGAVIPEHAALLAPYLSADANVSVHADDNDTVVYAAQRRMLIAGLLKGRGKPTFVASRQRLRHVRQRGAHLVGDELAQVIAVDSPGLPHDFLDDLISGTLPLPSHGERPLWLSACGDPSVGASGVINARAVKHGKRLTTAVKDYPPRPAPQLNEAQQTAKKVKRMKERHRKKERLQETKDGGYTFSPLAGNRFAALPVPSDEEVADDPSQKEENAARLMANAAAASVAAAEKRRTKPLPGRKSRTCKVKGVKVQDRDFTVCCKVDRQQDLGSTARKLQLCAVIQLLAGEYAKDAFVLMQWLLDVQLLVHTVTSVEKGAHARLFSLMEPWSSSLDDGSGTVSPADVKAVHSLVWEQLKLPENLDFLLDAVLHTTNGDDHSTPLLQAERLLRQAIAVGGVKNEPTLNVVAAKRTFGQQIKLVLDLARHLLQHLSADAGGGLGVAGAVGGACGRAAGGGFGNADAVGADGRAVDGGLGVELPEPFNGVMEGIRSWLKDFSGLEGSLGSPAGKARAKYSRARGKGPRNIRDRGQASQDKTRLQTGNKKTNKQLNEEDAKVPLPNITDEVVWARALVRGVTVLSAHRRDAETLKLADEPLFSISLSDLAQGLSELQLEQLTSIVNQVGTEDGELKGGAVLATLFRFEEEEKHVDPLRGARFFKSLLAFCCSDDYQRCRSYQRVLGLARDLWSRWKVVPGMGNPGRQLKVCQDAEEGAATHSGSVSKETAAGLARKAWQYEIKTNGKGKAPDLPAFKWYVWRAMQQLAAHRHKGEVMYMSTLTNFGTILYSEAVVHRWKGRWKQARSRSNLGWGSTRDRWQVSFPVGSEKQLRLEQMNMHTAKVYAAEAGLELALKGSGSAAKKWKADMRKHREEQLGGFLPLDQLCKTMGVAACFADGKVQRKQHVDFKLGGKTVGIEQRRKLPVDGVAACFCVGGVNAWDMIKFAGRPYSGAGFKDEVLSMREVIFEGHGEGNEAVLTGVKLAVKATSPLPPPEETTQTGQDKRSHQLHQVLQRELHAVLDSKAAVAGGHGASGGGDASVSGQGAALGGIAGAGAAAGDIAAAIGPDAALDPGPQSKAKWRSLTKEDVTTRLAKDGSTLREHGIQAGTRWIQVLDLQAGLPPDIQKASGRLLRGHRDQQHGSPQSRFMVLGGIDPGVRTALTVCDSSTGRIFRIA